MTISCHPTLQPSLSPFLNQREMYFDNISGVHGFLLLKQFGPIALIETAQNTSIYYLFIYFLNVELLWVVPYPEELKVFLPICLIYY